jgi:hypothetical protein
VVQELQWLEVFEEKLFRCFEDNQAEPAFFMLQLSARVFLFQQLAQGFGQLSENSVREGCYGLANEADFVGGKGSTRRRYMLLNHGRNIRCLPCRTRLGEGCSAQNAAGENKSSVAGILDQAGKWVEATVLGNANNWEIDGKSS